MTRTAIDTTAIQEAREDLAARLERLARRVRDGQQATPTTEMTLDAAYSEVVKLACRLQEGNVLG
jgi:hypothetical protein